jgi:fructosamine-3-kinase
MARARADCRRLADRSAAKNWRKNSPAFFVDYRPKASLLHGDLWNGNAAMCGRTRPARAVRSGGVFRRPRGGPRHERNCSAASPKAFYVAYREAWPLAEGYESRKTLYNLYHVLNHLNLFGAGYLRQAERMVDKLLAELRG